MLNCSVESLRGRSKVNAISGLVASLHQYQHLTVKKQQWILKLFVWHDGLKTPIELVDETKKPLVLCADKTCSLEELKWLIQEMVIIHPLLSGVFPQVTKQNVHDSIQVCKRSDKMEWVPLGKTAQTVDREDEEKESGANTTTLQLIPEVDYHHEQEREQVLVESKFEGGDSRRGKFYSDLAWRLELQIGQLVDALDTDNQWYESRVIAMNSDSVKVHYRGWGSKWDEWLSRTSSRLAPLHTKVRNWRAFHVDDEIMVGSKVPGKVYPEWRNARVTACVTNLRIEVDVDGKKRWLDAQDELLCPKGTHKAMNARTDEEQTKKRRIEKETAWYDQLQINQLIDARDTSNVWYESRVVALSATLIKVHYRGWPFKWDEWINRTSTRIAPLHTKVQNWRDFKVGNAVMVGQRVVGKSCPEWRNAVVTACEFVNVDQLRIEVNVDGTKQWMDAQDEMLCPPGMHKASYRCGDFAKISPV